MSGASQNKELFEDYDGFVEEFKKYSVIVLWVDEE